MDGIFSHGNKYLFFVVFYRSYKYFKISTSIFHKINNIYNLILKRNTHYLLFKIFKMSFSCGVRADEMYVRLNSCSLKILVLRCGSFQRHQRCSQTAFVLHTDLFYAVSVDGTLQLNKFCATTRSFRLQSDGSYTTSGCLLRHFGRWNTAAYGTSVLFWQGAFHAAVRWHLSYT